MALDKLSGIKTELITTNVDVVTLLGHAAHELSHLRPEKLRPAL